MLNPAIITHELPNCIFCGGRGTIYQENALDPDGLIQTPWTFRQCNNHVCQLVWLTPAPLETELWKAYTSYHTHTKQKNIC